VEGAFAGGSNGRFLSLVVAGVDGLSGPAAAADTVVTVVTAE